MSEHVTPTVRRATFHSNWTRLLLSFLLVFYHDGCLMLHAMDDGIMDDGGVE